MWYVHCSLGTNTGRSFTSHLSPLTNQQPSTINHQPSTNNQQPTTNNQQPTINNQQPSPKTKLFPFWVVGSVVAGMLFPAALAGFKDRYIELALGLTMVCMGCTLTVDDFKSVLARPKAVALGICAQFMVMIR